LLAAVIASRYLQAFGTIDIEYDGAVNLQDAENFFFRIG
jgi:hypothetical protein